MDELRTVDTRTPDPDAAPATPGLVELFAAFSLASLAGFGGVLPWARRMAVEDRRWLTAEEFNDAFSLCQFLPGPNILNFAVVFGARARGAAGAVISLLGLIAPSVILVTLAGALYVRFGDVETLRRALAGVSAAASGLLLGTVAKMAAPLFRRPFGPAPFVAAAVLALVGFANLSLPVVFLVCTPVSILIAWWRLE